MVKRVEETISQVNTNYRGMEPKSVKRGSSGRKQVQHPQAITVLDIATRDYFGSRDMK